MTWFLDLIGYRGLNLLGLVGPLILWFIVGLRGKFENETERNDWQWAGLFVGVLILTYLAALNLR